MEQTHLVEMGINQRSMDPVLLIYITKYIDCSLTQTVYLVFAE